MKKDYTVIRSKRKTLSVEIRSGKVTVRAPARTSDREIEDFILIHSEWIRVHTEKQIKKEKQRASVPKLTEKELLELKEKAKCVFSEKVKHFSAIVGVSYGRITVRCQKTRWGSCSAKGNLNFNCLLLLCPENVVDSVVVHELCHRKYMDHSGLFYNEVRKVFPDYDVCRKWLKENGQEIMMRMPD